MFSERRDDMKKDIQYKFPADHGFIVSFTEKADDKQEYGFSRQYKLILL
jgi:hypothetical protein